MFKKLLMVTLSLVMVMGFSSQSFADENSEEKRLENELKAIEQYEKLVENGFNNDAEVVSQYDTKQKESSKEDFAGAYINNQGNLVILVTQENNRFENIFKEIINDQNVNVKYVKNSQQDLKKLQNEISSSFEKLISDGIQIRGVGIDIEDNKVFVEVLKPSESDIKDIFRFADESILKIIEINEEHQFDSTDVYGGKEVVSDDNGGKSTLSFCAKRDMGFYSQYGVVISGHAGNSVGETFIYNGVTLGDIQKTGWFNNSNADVAFIPVNTSNFNLKDSISGCYITGVKTTFIQGMTVYSSGKVTPYNSGKILSTSVDIVFTGGIKIKDLVKADYTAIAGDSGAPITVNSGSHTDAIIGVHSGGTSFEYFNKITNIMDYLDLESVVTY